MKKEIEYRFLVVGSPWEDGQFPARALRQFYLVTDPGATVRVRIAGEKGVLTVKGLSSGSVRDEEEVPISLEIAQRLEDYRRGEVVEKIRHLIPWGGRTWEVDEFQGTNAGLAICELEVEREGEAFERPPFAGRDITGDH